MQAIYDYFSTHGAWPKFTQIDRPIRREHDWDIADIVQELSESVLIPPRPGGLRPVPQDHLQLTLQGIATCAGSTQDTERFVQTLRWLAQQEMAYGPAIDTDNALPRVPSSEIAAHLGLGADDPLSLQRLHSMLDLDHWGLGGFGEAEDHSWYVMLTPDIWRFRHVQTVEDCVKVRADWVAEGQRHQFPSGTFMHFNGPVQSPFATFGTAPADAEPPETSRPPYIAEQITDAIRAKAGQSRFDLTKLLALIAELNDNCAEQHTYAAHALLRAVLDHIPPILGYRTFEQAVNNYQWPRTDKQYMRKLLDFRSQGDDALHRPISEKVSLLDFSDMPPGIWINQLLQECADRL